jgi:ERCC4-type nuclease
MFDRLGIPYEKEEIRIPAKCKKFPLRHTDGELLCVQEPDGKVLLLDDSFQADHLACQECEHKSLRIGDFTNTSRSFIAERKRVDDFYASMADGRLYNQARKMYSYCSGLKVIILEGMGGMSYIEDGHNPFEKIEEDLKEEYAKSPIQQLIDMKPDKADWIWGIIKDMASCEVALVQSWNLEETVRIVEQISAGSGTEPKVRAIPKKVPGLSIDEQILTVLPGIGKARAQNMIAQYGSLKKVITSIREMPKENADRRSITKKLKEIFG